MQYDIITTVNKHPGYNLVVHDVDWIRDDRYVRRRVEPSCL